MQTSTFNAVFFVIILLYLLSILLSHFFMLDTPSDILPREDEEVWEEVDTKHEGARNGNNAEIIHIEELEEEDQKEEDEEKEDEEEEEEEAEAIDDEAFKKSTLHQFISSTTLLITTFFSVLLEFRSKNVLFYFVVIVVQQVCKSGEVDVTLLYTAKSPLNWSKWLYGYFLALDYACLGLSTAILLPFLLMSHKTQDISLAVIGMAFKVFLFKSVFFLRIFILKVFIKTILTMFELKFQFFNSTGFEVGNSIGESFDKHNLCSSDFVLSKRTHCLLPQVSHQQELRSRAPWQTVFLFVSLRNVFQLDWKRSFQFDLHEHSALICRLDLFH